MERKSSLTAKVLRVLDVFPGYSVKFVYSLENSKQLFFVMIRIWDDEKDLSLKSWDFYTAPSSTVNTLIDYYTGIFLWSKESF